MVNPDTQLRTAAQIRAIEAQVMQSVIEGGMGIDGHTLMQRAGQRVRGAVAALAGYSGHKRSLR